MMRARTFRPFAAWMGVCLLALTPAARGQDLPADLALVKQMKASFAAVRPADLLASKLMGELPQRMRAEIEQAVRGSDQFLGIAAADMERLTLVALPEKGSGAVLLRTTRPFDVERVRKAVAPEARAAKHGNYTVYANEGRRPSLVLVDDRTLMMAEARVLLDVLLPGKGEAMPDDALTLAAENHHVVLGGSPFSAVLALWLTRSSHAEAHAHEAIGEAPARASPEGATGPKPNPRPERKPDPPPEAPKPPAPQAALALMAVALYGMAMEVPTLEQMLSELPPEALPFKPLFEARYVALALDVGETSKVQLKAFYESEAKAEDGETSLRTSLYVLRELPPLMFAREAGISLKQSPKIWKAYEAYAEALRKADIRRDGKVVQAALSLKTDPAELAALRAEMDVLALPTISANNLRQIGIALHSHHDAFQFLPPPAITDANGKRLLSWRVAILPFIEQENLYRQFKLDEPWDSPHNLALLERMPKVYAPLGDADVKPNTTFYQVFNGPGTMFPGPQVRPGPGAQGVRMAQVPDGLSNTFMVVEAGEAVPWTKPDDLVYDPRQPLPKLGGNFKDGFHALLGDGSVTFIKKGYNADALRTLITGQDGMITNWELIPTRQSGRRGFSSNLGAVRSAHEGYQSAPATATKEEKPPAKPE